MEATFHLIEQQGYHGTGLNQIIKESGAPKGSLYYYFPNGKEELVAEAIKEYGQSLINRIQSVLIDATDPAEVTQLIFINLAKKMDESQCTKAGSFASVTLETANSSAILQKACKTMYDGCTNAYQEMLQKHGFSKARAVQIASFITSSMEGAIVLCRAKRNSQPLIQAAEELYFYLKMLLDNNTK